MSTIRCIYHDIAPNFPATDQHPDAERYGPITINGERYFVDAIGGQPTNDEITAVLAPAPAVPEEISDRQFAQILKQAGLITFDEALAFVQVGQLPAALQTAVDAIADTTAREDAEILIAGATVFKRHHPMTEALGVALSKSPSEIDALWTAAAQL